jgi:citronellol/citronellal dehydrogenase
VGAYDRSTMSAIEGRSKIFAGEALSGVVVLITGGGTGLGRETALEMARCGASVTIAGRRAEVLEEAASMIANEAAPVHCVAGDIREAAEAARIVAQVLERSGRLDVLVNNAGGQFYSPAELIAAKGWRAVWRLNVDGMLNMSEAAFRLAFEPAGSGNVINVTLSPHHGMPGLAHSGAARAAVEALTRELAQRWMKNNVTVTAVAAGHFDTEILAKYPASVRAGTANSVPLGRLGTPAEHAWLVTLLASPLGRSLNGSTITLDGARDNWFGRWPPGNLLDEAGDVPVEARRPQT